ncbi:MAG TPA: DUF488 domain-containing protein [Ramlibacter sp.]|jgi:uncharacterized protein (DUF488 family)
MHEVFSIGHSDLEIDAFLDLLRQWKISAIADVRSSPFSRRSPWFSHDELRMELAHQSIRYVYLGRELGGRPSTDDLYEAGTASYHRMALTSEFGSGLDRVLTGAGEYRIALMCSERDPLHCHRCLLVGRALKKVGIEVQHILHSGKIENQTQSEERMMHEEGLVEDLVSSHADKLMQAYIKRNQRYAYSRSEVQKWKKNR